jgi:hypothetical protein
MIFLNKTPMTLGNMRATGVGTLAVLPRLLAAQTDSRTSAKIRLIHSDFHFTCE